MVTLKSTESWKPSQPVGSGVRGAGGCGGSGGGGGLGGSRVASVNT